MKYWPAFLRRLAQPFFPKNVLYYDIAPPHHLVSCLANKSNEKRSRARGYASGNFALFELTSRFACYWDLRDTTLVQFVGSFGYLAFTVTVQMTRVYIASESGRDVR
jgi:hypothetical protein